MALPVRHVRALLALHDLGLCRVTCPTTSPPGPLAGRKWDNKMYRWHTGYPGGLKERTAKEMYAKKPDAILREAVLGMLPKNNLRRVRGRGAGRWGLEAAVGAGWGSNT